MKLNLSLKHLIIEVLLAVGIASLLSLFSKDFSFWLIAVLVILLIWHHYNEFSLLQIINPNKPLKAKRKLLRLSIFHKPLPTTMSELAAKKLNRYGYFPS